MPANLTPQCLKAEAEYRRAGTPEEELQCLELMLRELPKHKGTDKLQAELKQKISKTKKELKSLRGLWQGAFPEDYDLNATLREIRGEWEKEWAVDPDGNVGGLFHAEAESLDHVCKRSFHSAEVRNATNEQQGHYY